MAFAKPLILAFVLLCAANLAGEVTPKPTGPAAPPSRSPSLLPAIGLNKFDLARQYLGGTTGDGKTNVALQKVSQAMARKAIIDARNTGVKYFRVGITGIAPLTYNTPGELDLWMKDSARYWEVLDQMMADLESNQLQIIPVFVWQPSQFAVMTGEKGFDTITNPNSKSYTLLLKYVTEFIERYKSRPLVYFYELTNELNIAADIDEEKRCRDARGAAACGMVRNITTANLIGFTRRLAAQIRKLDSSRLISSGFAMPRGNAEHLRAIPEFVNLRMRKPDDTVTEFIRNLRDIHEDLDIVSVHFYNQQDNERFGVKGHENADVLGIIKQATDKMGKLLFVGEFADKSPTVSESLTGPFTQAVFRKTVELKIPFSAPWAWEFYHRPATKDDMGREDTSLEPGLTDLVISKLTEANRELGQPVPAEGRSDETLPNVVAYYPLEGATLASPQQPIYVTASAKGGIASVELLVDGKVVDTLKQGPFRFQLTTTSLSAGPHEITARAHDRSNNVQEYRLGSLQKSPGVESLNKPAGKN